MSASDDILHVMYEALNHTLQGTLAKFLPDYDSDGLKSPLVPGYVHLTDQNELLIDTITPPLDFADVGSSTRMPLPSAIPAITTKTSVLFLDIQGVRGNQKFGGKSISTRSFRARFVAVHVDASSLRSTGLTRLQAHFPGLTRWSGIQSITTSHEKADNGKLVSLTATVRSRDDVVEPVDEAQSLTLSTHWDVTGADDRRIINAPVSIASRSESPLELHEHLDDLIAVQDLLSLAYKGFVVADGGIADFDVPNHNPLSTTPQWWSSHLMTIPKGVEAPKSMTEFPTFNLSDIGGLTGVVDWIKLNRDHPRAVGPLAMRYRLGGMAVESQILNMGVAFEYWIAVNRRNHPWARKLDNEPLCAPLVRHVGDSFATFVGDPVAWADKFWDAYNTLKHRPTSAYDPYEYSLLAESAVVLMECALLNHVAKTDQPSKSICGTHRNHHLGDEIRSVLRSH